MVFIYSKHTINWPNLAHKAADHSIECVKCCDQASHRCNIFFSVLFHFLNIIICIFSRCVRVYDHWSICMYMRDCALLLSIVVCCCHRHHHHCNRVSTLSCTTNTKATQPHNYTHRNAYRQTKRKQNESREEERETREKKCDTHRM